LQYLYIGQCVFCWVSLS